MGAVNATHPIGASKRAGKRSIVRATRGGGGGWFGALFGLLVLLALVVGAIAAVLSLPGHVIGLTPSLGQVFGHHRQPHYLAARYSHLILGYVLVGAGLLALVITALVAASAPRARALTIGGTVILLLAFVAVLTGTGERSHPLTAAQVFKVPKDSGRSPALHTVADRYVLSQIEDTSNSVSWAVVPGGCTFHGVSTDFLGTTFNYACVAQAFNGRLHRVEAFKVQVGCGRIPTLAGCSTGRDGEGIHRLKARPASSSSMPSSVGNHLADILIPVMIGSCHAKAGAGVVTKSSPGQVKVAVEFATAAELYGRRPFRVAAGAPVISADKLLREASDANAGCRSEVATILNAALPADKSQQ